MRTAQLAIERPQCGPGSNPFVQTETSLHAFAK